ncbi:DUF6300 family protein [Streptosporangium canum]|uniref:DUF6300 family protein n=1 Tax=Streptosporangium canum TaxID=324952 RepID=UPI00368A6E5D
MTGAAPIEIRSASEPSPCPRCGKDGILSALVSHGWTNASGGDVRGWVTVVLCADCDADAPHSAPLITWFHVNGIIDADNSGEFVKLLHSWAEHVRVPDLDEAALEREIDAWRRGEL